jgi:lysophospholipase L1-like esterase
LYIGDSVSIGGEPVVANLSSTFAYVEHSPWSGGGGADDIGNGLTCQEAFLRLSDWELAKWDYILFNFGLHDLTQSDSNKEFYRSGLTNFTSNLQVKQPQAKLVYVTTTPFMPLRYYNNSIVEDLNEIAGTIMNAQSIPIIDTYDAVINVCGKVYSQCSLCDSEPSAWPPNAPPGAFCGYHYTPAGWQLLGSVISDALKKIIGA